MLFVCVCVRVCVCVCHGCKSGTTESKGQGSCHGVGVGERVEAVRAACAHHDTTLSERSAQTHVSSFFLLPVDVCVCVCACLWVCVRGEPRLLETRRDGEKGGEERDVEVKCDGAAAVTRLANHLRPCSAIFSSSLTRRTMGSTRCEREGGPAACSKGRRGSTSAPCPLPPSPHVMQTPFHGCCLLLQVEMPRRSADPRLMPDRRPVPQLVHQQEALVTHSKSSHCVCVCRMVSPCLPSGQK